MSLSKTALALVLAAFTVLLPLAACAPHRVTPAGAAAYDDATISTRVKTALLNDPQISALHIDVTSQQGVVTLSGTAKSAGDEQKAVAVARGVPGVKDVRSNLKVGG